MYGFGLVTKSCLIFTTPWAVACQAPLENSPATGMPFTSPRGLPDPGIEPRSPALQADSLLIEL